MSRGDLAARLLLLLVGMVIGGAAAFQVTRRIYLKQLAAARSPRLIGEHREPEMALLSPAPEAPPVRKPRTRKALEASPEPAGEFTEYMIRDRTRSGEILEISELPGWEAEIRDKGHRRGFVIRIRQTGAEEPVEVIQAEGLLRGGARDLAVSTLRARQGHAS